MRFYENHARPVDKKEMSEAKQYNDQLMRQLQNNLEAKRIEYQGSSYEGIKTRSSELEFDCMVVLPGGDELEQDATGVQTGFSKLHLEDEDSNLTKFVEGDGYLSPQLVRESFYGSLTKAVDDLPQSETVKIRKHGDAAVQLDIKRPSGPKKGQFWYSVDVVPGYEVGGEAFIPKSSKRKEKTKKKKKTVVTTENGDTNGASTTVKKKKAKKPKTTTEAATAGVPKKKKKSPKKLTWRRSFAAEEKECMSDLDVGNQCHKMCARTLKVIVNIDPPLRALQSYAIKTTVLRYDKENPGKSWQEEDFPARFLDLLEQLRVHLITGQLSHFFLGEESNILEGTNPKHLEQMSLRIRSLLTRKPRMQTLLNDW